MTTIKSCAICSGQHSAMREHCPYCGARPIYIAQQSWMHQPRIELMFSQTPGANITHRNITTNRELIRAYRSDLAFSLEVK